VELNVRNLMRSPKDQKGSVPRFSGVWRLAHEGEIFSYTH